MAAYTQVSSYLYYGLSTDTKPTGVPLPTLCYETDTSKCYITRDGTNWTEASANLLGGIPFLPDYVTDTSLATAIAVSAQNTADNVDIVDVIGNKTDTVAGDSIISLLKAIKAKTDTL
jgi:hypothetical protein